MNTVDSENKKCLKSYIGHLIQYETLFRSLVVKDLKGKFKHTILGSFWHLLNPISQIIIYYVIFTIIFGKDIHEVI